MEDTNPEVNESELRAKIDASNARVMFLLDELRRMFVPEYRITFVARNPNKDGVPFTYLTDDTDVKGLIKLLESSSSELKPVSSNNAGVA